MIKKNCAVCGKEFEAANYRYCLCSDECRRVRDRIQRATPEYRARHNERNRSEYRKKRRENFKVIPCKICGKPIEPEFRDDHMCRKYYHESCVLSEALQAVSEGAGTDDKRIRRAKNRFGYTLKELREEMGEE